MFWEGRNNGNTHYVFASDMNGDGASDSDLIYIPRDISEMNFSQFTAHEWPHVHRRRAGAGVRDLYPTGRVPRDHRGEYAKRGAVCFRWCKRAWTSA